MRQSSLAIIICLLALLHHLSAKAQYEQAEENLVFNDTLFGVFAIDSLSHDFGAWWPEERSTIVVKKLKYLGQEPAVITGVFNQSPHYVYRYPRRPLEPNKVYTIQFSFYNSRERHRGGSFEKKMGFRLHDGRRIGYRFTWKYEPKQAVEEKPGDALEGLKEHNKK